MVVKYNTKKFIIIFIIGFIGIVGYKTLTTQQRFDPNSVQSENCKPDQLQCGFNPDPVEKVESVPLAESTMISHRGLPSKVDLSKNMPPVLNQGRQNSCVAFSTGYYTKSYYEYLENKWKYDPPLYGGRGEYVFSPAYIYNQINGGQDRGSYFVDALNLVVQKGVSPWKYMPYRENDYLTQPKREAHQVAQKFKAKSFRRIPFDNLDAIKSELANGNPIIFGIVVDDNFYQLGSDGNYVFDNPGGKQYGGHAMTLVGYDDNLRSPRGHVGAFKLINSWGTSWADNGYGWISYRTWMQLRPYVYVLNDEMGTNTIQNELETEVTQDEYIPSPGNISATKGTYPDKIVITWKSVSVAIAYAILRLDPGSSDFQLIGYSYSNSFIDKSIVPNISYQYTVFSLADEKTSDPKKAIIVSGYASTQTNVVDVPKIYNVRGELRDNQVFLEWDSVPGAKLYQIRRWDNTSQKWLIWNKPIYNNSFIDPAPLKNQVNRYSVRASINNQYGEWSSPIEINIPGESTPPSKPQITDVSQGIYRDRIVINWNSVVSAERYAVFRYDYNTQMWEGPFVTTENQFIDNDPKIQNGDYFAYTVVALNSFGQSDYSNVVVGNANPNVHRAGEVLSPPKNVQIQLKGNKVILIWDKVEGASEYYIYRKKKKEKEFQFVSNVGNQNRFEENFPGQKGELFFYVVRGKPEMGKESENSKPVVAFLNPDIEIVSHRFMPAQGIEKFLGKWSGNYWDGSSKIQNYILNIKNKEDLMIIEVENQNKKEMYQTKYPALSDVVSFKEFELQYKPDFEILILQGKQGNFTGKTITFTKK